jgi:uncharacterized protein (DUF608 family)
MRVSRRNLLLTTAAAAAAPAQTTSKPAATPAPIGRRFTGQALREIAFPLGGIGTGTVSLTGSGALRDWEIFNRPNKGSFLPFTFAALRLEGGGMVKPRIRVVERRPMPPFTGRDGPTRLTALGLPRFREATFTGAYPFANIRFSDTALPVAVSLEAFNPMIPLATGDSSLPVAILTYRLTSRAKSKLDAALAFTLMNPVGYDGHSKLGGRQADYFGSNLNEFKNDGGASGILMTSAKYPAGSFRNGSLALATDARDVSYRLQWEHGAWWDDFQKWWDEFLVKGRFANTPTQASADKTTEFATLAAHVSLAPGETKDITFVLAWHFPLGENYGARDPEAKSVPLKNEYGTKWKSAWEPATGALRNLKPLRDRSARYRDTLHGSTLPAPVIDAVSSQASILRTNTVMVMEGKRTLAYEGCNDNGGCCPMNCTHVYNYEQALAHLYPDLERSMRETDYLVNMRPDSSMSFRTLVPLKKGGNDFHPAADGQMGCVMKVYREWQLSGDDEFLRRLWPDVKRSLEYAWKQWDADRDGVMEGQQHNTYDIEFYGPNSMMGSLYLGALLAASRMARYLGDTASAQSYEALAAAGSQRLDQALYNGEYYVQKVDESRKESAKYQYGEGCLSDQLLGQWFAEVVHLGKVLPREHIRAALGAIWRYNFRQDFGDWPNTQRLYALNDEKGLVLCSWPRGKRPALPFPYSDEVWTGIEYQVAAHFIYEGMIQEGLAVVKAVRDRYDGISRNPWNEIECGHHYARAMSSWSLLLALSGYGYSAPLRELRFRPAINAGNFRALYTTGSAWGSYAQKATSQKLDAEIRVEEGALTLATLRLPAPKAGVKVVSKARAKVRVEQGEAIVTFDKPVEIKAGGKLAVTLA